MAHGEQGSYTPMTEPSGQRTIDELGETIVSVGMFWESWWNLTGLFAFEHIEWFELDERPEYLIGKGHDWGWLSTESGLENDIRNFFLQHYTEAGLGAELTRQFFPVVEYNGVLYIHGTRAGLARPNWKTATHILTEQDGSRAVVETTVLVGGWHRTDLDPMDYAWEEQFRFTFVDGRIDSIDKIELQYFAAATPVTPFASEGPNLIPRIEIPFAMGATVTLTDVHEYFLDFGNHSMGIWMAPTGTIAFNFAGEPRCPALGTLYEGVPFSFQDIASRIMVVPDVEWIDYVIFFLVQTPIQGELMISTDAEYLIDAGLDDWFVLNINMFQSYEYFVEQLSVRGRPLREIEVFPMSCAVWHN